VGRQVGGQQLVRGTSQRALAVAETDKFPPSIVSRSMNESVPEYPSQASSSSPRRMEYRIHPLVGPSSGAHSPRVVRTRYSTGTGNWAAQVIFWKRPCHVVVRIYNADHIDRRAGAY
jgi:hypothetical protein